MKRLAIIVFLCALTVVAFFGSVRLFQHPASPVGAACF
jgi:hypothetical protein